MDLILQAALVDLLGEQQRVGGGGADHSRFEVDHHLDLLVGVAGAHRDGHGAELLAAGLESDARCPQPVAGCDLDAVFGGDTGDLIAARKHRGPVVDVLFGIGDDDGLSRGAGRGVNTDDLFLRYSLDPERVGVAQVRFVGKRDFLEIFGCGDAFKSRFFVQFAVIISAGQNALDLLVDKRKLLFIDLHGIYLVLSVDSCMSFTDFKTGEKCFFICIRQTRWYSLFNLLQNGFPLQAELAGTGRNAEHDDIEKLRGAKRRADLFPVHSNA